jgi:hypothetical protein
LPTSSEAADLKLDRASMADPSPASFRELRAFRLAAPATKRRAHGACIVRKDPTACAGHASALFACVVSSDIQQRNTLIVAALFARIFTISNYEQFYARIKVAPFYSAYLILAHCRCNSKLMIRPIGMSWRLFRSNASMSRSSSS